MSANHFAGRAVLEHVATHAFNLILALCLVVFAVNVWYLKQHGSNSVAGTANPQKRAYVLGKDGQTAPPVEYFAPRLASATELPDTYYSRSEAVLLIDHYAAHVATTKEPAVKKEELITPQHWAEMWRRRPLNVVGTFAVEVAPAHIVRKAELVRVFKDDAGYFALPK